MGHHVMFRIDMTTASQSIISHVTLGINNFPYKKSPAWINWGCMLVIAACTTMFDYWSQHDDDVQTMYSVILDGRTHLSIGTDEHYDIYSLEGS